MDDNCVELYLTALITAAFDSDEAVCQQIAESLRELVRQRPGLVLTSCHTYLSSAGASLPEGHRLALLRSMALIVGETVEGIEQPLAREVIAVTAEAMTTSDEATCPRQEAGSELLVALGRGFANEVLEEMLQKVTPGIPPHPLVIKTLADLSITNVHGTVPHLPRVLTALLPAFSLVKENRSAQALISAFGLFSKSILEYFAPSDKAPDPTLSKETFSQPIYTAYKKHLPQWLQEKDANLRGAILEALGHMVPLLPNDKLEEELPSLVPQILSLYRRKPDRLPVTQCLRSVLGASVGMSSHGLKGHLDKLLGTLHGQLCPLVASDDQPGLESRGQILGCFGLLAQAWPEPAAQFLLRKLAGTSGRERAAGLLALGTLLDTVPSRLEGLKHQIMAAVKGALLGDSSAVKRAVLQIVSSLANHGYLELVGGKALVEYVIRLCATPRGEGPARGRGSVADALPADELRTMAVTLVEQLAATERAADVLWPTLLQLVTPGPSAEALPVVCRVLETLAGGRRQRGTLRPFDGRPGLPPAQALLARLLAVASAPDRGRGGGLPALRLLLALGPAIHPALQRPWEEQLPGLIRQLQAHPESGIVRERWEERLLLLLSGSLEVIAEEQWARSLAEQLMQQVSQLPSYPQERGFLFQCMGVVLKLAKREVQVGPQLQEMLQCAQYHQEPEREGLALGIGLCAATHYDDALSQLGDFTRRHLSLASLVGALKERLSSEPEKVRSGLLLCYGQVARQAPAARVLPRADADILGPVLLLYRAGPPGLKGESQGSAVKLSLAKAVALAAQAVLANGPGQPCHCARKGELLECLQGVIRAEPTGQLGSPIRHFAILACADLIQLAPPSSGAQTCQLLRTCVGSVLGLPPLEGQAGTGAPWAEQKNLVRETSAALQKLLSQVLLQDLSPSGLLAVFKHLECWVVSGKDYERERALELTLKMLVLFLENLNVQAVVTHYNLEAIVGRLIPRCADPLLAIRQLAVECLYVLFYVQLRYEGFAAEERDGSVEHLKVIKESLDQSDSDSHLRRCSDIARVVSEHMSCHQLRNLLPALCEGLRDSQPDCANASAAVIHALIRSRGEGLQDHVSELLRALRGALGPTGHEQVRLAVRRSVAVLAARNTAAVVTFLLAGPDPFEQAARDLWRSLAAVGPRVSERLLAELNAATERLEGGQAPAALAETGPRAQRPVAAAWALSAVLSAPEPAAAIGCLYPRLVGSLLVLCSCARELPKHRPSKRPSVGTTSPENFDFRDYSVATLKVLLTQGEGKEMVGFLEAAGGWEMMKNPNTYHDGVALLAEAMATNASPHLGSVIEYLATTLNLHKKQRIAVAAFLGEMVNHHVGLDLRRMNTLVSSLLRCLLDSCPTTRFLAIQGLGNVALGDPAKTRRYSTKLLAAIMAVIQAGDEPQDCITLEGLSGLSKILAQLEENDVRDILVNLGLGIRPFFESRSDRVRAAAFVVFGALSRLAVGESKPVFVEQVHSALVSLVLHLNDSSTEVAEACRRVLASVGPFLGLAKPCATFQIEFPQATDQSYLAFLSKLTGTIASDLPDYIQTYLSVSVQFCSHWSPDIRASAVIFTGRLLKDVPQDNNQLCPDDHIHDIIRFMIRDPAASVRMTTAKTLSLFC